MITKSRYQVFLKCYCNEKMFFSFSLNSDFIFGKNAPCQLLWLNFKNKSDFFNYGFLFKLSAITRFCFSRLALRELDREKKVTSSTYEFNISLCPPTTVITCKPMQHKILCFYKINMFCSSAYHIIRVHTFYKQPELVPVCFLLLLLN